MMDEAYPAEKGKGKTEMTCDWTKLSEKAPQALGSLKMHNVFYG